MCKWDRKVLRDSQGCPCDSIDKQDKSMDIGAKNVRKFGGVIYSFDGAFKVSSPVASFLGRFFDFPARDVLVLAFHAPLTRESRANAGPCRRCVILRALELA